MPVPCHRYILVYTWELGSRLCKQSLRNHIISKLSVLFILKAILNTEKCYFQLLLYRVLFLLGCLYSCYKKERLWVIDLS